MLLNGSCKPLRQPELFDLIRRAQAGDVGARNRVVASMMKLVIRHANGVARKTGLLQHRDDMVTAACCGHNGRGGIMRAIELFDTTRGFKWSTYAIYWIGLAVQSVVSDALHDGASRDVVGHLQRIRTTNARLEEAAKRPVSVEEIRADYRSRGLPVPQPDRVERALGAPRVAEAAALYVAADPGEGIDARRDADELHAAIALLPEPEQHVMRCLLREQDIAEIAKGLGITRKAAAAIEASGKAMLLEALG